jgi:hypothetical protein
MNLLVALLSGACGVLALLLAVQTARLRRCRSEYWQLSRYRHALLIVAAEEFGVDLAGLIRAARKVYSDHVEGRHRSR